MPMVIARKMVELCRQGKNAEALDTLFSHDLVSIEATAPPGVRRITEGLPEVKQKGERWLINNEVHASSVTGPWQHDYRFLVGFQYDVTNRATGKRTQLEEFGLYTVRDQKIVREEFFYDT